MKFLESEKKLRCEDLSGNCFQHVMIEEWLTWLRDARGCSPQSCNSRLSSLRTFLRYLGSRDVTYLHLYQAATGIPYRKCRKTQVNGMTKAAVKALMNAPNTSSRTGRRDLAFIILLYSTAARLDEVLAMKNTQLHLSTPRPYVSIVGKGDKVRTLYLLPKVVAHLERYQREWAYQ